MVKFKYWVEQHSQMTSNSQLTSSGWFSNHVSATRSADDTLARVLLKAQFSYASDASGAVPGWWAQASVYAVADWDPAASLTVPTAVGGGTPLERRLLADKLFPARYSNPEFSPDYQVVWTGSSEVVSAEGQRKGNGSNLPRVTYGVRALDQYSFFTPLAPAEAAGIYRASIIIRTLWLSDVGP